MGKRLGWRACARRGAAVVAVTLLAMDGAQAQQPAWTSAFQPAFDASGERYFSLILHQQGAGPGQSDAAATLICSNYFLKDANGRVGERGKGKMHYGFALNIPFAEANLSPAIREALTRRRDGQAWLDAAGRRVLMGYFVEGHEIGLMAEPAMPDETTMTHLVRHLRDPSTRSLRLVDAKGAPALEFAISNAGLADVTGELVARGCAH